MLKRLQLLIFGKNLISGILTPVLTLVMLTRGATLSTGSLLIGLYSFTVISAEFPSGVFADLCGRKNAFALAMLLSGCGYALLLLAAGPVTLAGAIVLLGLGRAFSSGSVDALAMDGAQGEAGLTWVATRLSILESVGLAVGSVAGAWLSGLDARYSWNVGVNLGLCAVLLGITGWTFRRRAPWKNRRIKHARVQSWHALPSDFTADAPERGRTHAAADQPAFMLGWKLRIFPQHSVSGERAPLVAPSLRSEHRHIADETAETARGFVRAQNAVQKLESCIRSSRFQEHGILTEHGRSTVCEPPAEPGDPKEHGDLLEHGLPTEHGVLAEHSESLRYHFPAEHGNPPEHDNPSGNRFPAEHDTPSAHTANPACPVPTKHGQPSTPTPRGRFSRILPQMRQSFAFATRQGMPRRIFILAAVTGFGMLSLETYWQPALSAFSPAPWAFGALSLAGFICVMLAGKLAGRTLGRIPQAAYALLLAQRAAVGLCLFTLPWATQPGWFVGGYALYYLFIGGGGVMESALINREAPSAQRASILSLLSLVLQLGGLAGSLAGFLISRYTDYHFLWFVAGAILLLTTGTLAVCAARQRTRQSPPRSRSHR